MDRLRPSLSPAPRPSAFRPGPLARLSRSAPAFLLPRAVLTLGTHFAHPWRARIAMNEHSRGSAPSQGRRRWRGSHQLPPCPLGGATGLGPSWLPRPFGSNATGEKGPKLILCWLLYPSKCSWEPQTKMSPTCTPSKGWRLRPLPRVLAGGSLFWKVTSRDWGSGDTP